MQTFLPYKDFESSARCLDRHRLGKQRIEARMILDILNGKRSRWENHPAVLMWTGYTGALEYYLRCVVEEWTRRGYKNTILFCKDRVFTEFVPWITEEFVSSHRANLLRKNYEWYSQFNWHEKSIDFASVKYIWPAQRS